MDISLTFIETDMNLDHQVDRKKVLTFCLSTKIFSVVCILLNHKNKEPTTYAVQVLFLFWLSIPLILSNSDASPSINNVRSFHKFTIT